MMIGGHDRLRAGISGCAVTHGWKRKGSGRKPLRRQPGWWRKKAGTGAAFLRDLINKVLACGASGVAR
jgi:hypothetical protein